MINPYKELTPYLESDAYRFKGRSVEIEEMYESFDRNDYLVCHADSGEGKSSIIEAGLIPKMKANCYLPIRIIFNSDEHFKNSDVNFDDVICGIIENEIEKLKSDKDLSVDKIYPKRLTNSEERELKNWEKELINSYVWLKLRYIRITIDNLLYTPVLIFDQFEEVFTNPISQEWTDKFFAWMQELSMDLCPKKIVDEIEKNIGEDDFPEISTQKYFKCIFSLRSEYIGKLDYWGLQRHYIPFLKNNRYLLRPLTIKGAKEVITQQEGYDGLNNVADDIINIIRKSQKGKNYVMDESSDLPCISALFLSIICAQAFIMSQQERSAFIQSLATEKDEDKKSAINTLIEKFYETAISKCDIPSKDMDIIEDVLVNNDGNRQRVNSRTNALEKINFSMKYMDKLEKARLIRVIPEYNREEDSVELIHDSLAQTICRFNKRKRNEKLRKHNRRVKYFGIVLVAALVIAIGFIILLTLDNQKYQDEKGYGISQKIAIGFQEDSLIAAERELWRGKLLVLGITDNSTDTLFDRKINDYYRDSTLYVTLDSAKNVRFILNYDEALKNYHSVDTTFTIGQLTDSPIVKLLVHKIIPNLITYSSKVVANLNGEEVNIQEAIVIVRDKIHRTDVNGQFTIKLEDSLNVNDVICIVKRGFSCYESKDLIDSAGKFVPKFTITTADSLAAFDLECERVNATEWYYSTSKMNPQTLGERVWDGNDMIVFNANRVKGKKAKDGRFEVEGYYYFVNEYKSKGDYAYHFFTGWMDSQDLTKTGAAYKVFEVESYDFANNKQKVYGQFHRSGRISGIISVLGGRVAIFGPHKE